MSVTPDELRRIIAAATSDNDADGRARGLIAINEAKVRSGYAGSLATLIADPGTPVDARVQCLLLLKNQADALLMVASTPTAGKAPDFNGERALVKRALLDCAFNPVHDQSQSLPTVFYSTLFAAMAAVSRYEWPQSWPELVPTVDAAIQADNAAIRRRGLECFNELIAVWQGKRTPKSRQAFNALATSTVGTVTAIYTESISRIAQAVESKSNDQQSLLAFIRFASLSSRCGRKLLAGLEIDTSDASRALLAASLVLIRLALPLHAALSHNSPLCEALGTLLIRSFRMIVETEAQQPLAFRSFLPASIEISELILTSCSNPTNEQSRFDKLVSLSLAFLQSVLDQSRLKTRTMGKFSLSNGMEFNDAVVRETRTILANATSTVFVQRIAQLLVFQCFPLSGAELVQWRQAPEEFALEAKLDASHPRELAEQVLTLLCRDRIDEVGEQILQWTSHASSIAVDSDSQSLASKAAAYRAFGLAKAWLESFIDERAIPFDFATTLMPHFEREIETVLAALPSQRPPRSTELEVLLSRIFLLIGEWSSTINAEQARSVFARTLATLQSPATGRSVKFVSVDSLREFVSLMSIDGERTLVTVFVPLAPDVFQALLSLIQNTDEMQLKHGVLVLIGDLIAVMGPNIVTSVNTLVTALPALWQEAAGEKQLRSSLLTALSQLVTALEWLCDELLPFTAHCVSEALNDSDAFLQPFALELWLASLRAAPRLAPEFISLSQKLPTILSEQRSEEIEELQTVLAIIVSSIMLEPDCFARIGQAQNLAGALAGVYHSLGDVGLMQLLVALESIASVGDEHGLALLTPCFAPILAAVMNWFEPSVSEDLRVSPLVLTELLHLLARLLWDRRDAFVEWLMAQPQGARTMLAIAELTITRLDAVPELFKKKLMCLGVASMLAAGLTPAGVIEATLAPFLVAVDSLDTELQQNDADTAPTDAAAGSLAMDPSRRTEADRRAIFAARDSFAQIPLLRAIYSALEALQRRDAQLVQRQLQQMPDAISRSIQHKLQRDSARSR